MKIFASQEYEDINHIQCERSFDDINFEVPIICLSNTFTLLTCESVQITSEYILIKEGTSAIRRIKNTEENLNLILSYLKENNK